MDSIFLQHIMLMIRRRNWQELETKELWDYGLKIRLKNKVLIWVVTSAINAIFMKIFIQEWENKCEPLGILVYCHTVTFNAMKKLKAFLNLQLFSADRFYFDITEAVPFHKLWKSPIDQDYPAEAKQFPRILFEDPMCQYYGFNYNDIILVDKKDLYIIV